MAWFPGARFLQRPQAHRWLVVALLVASLGVRLAFALQRNHLLVSDMVDYDARGMLLLQRHTFQTGDFHGSTYHPPLYTVFLAGVYALFGHDLTAVYLVQALLGTAMLVGLYLLGRRLGGRGLGLLTLALAAAYLPFAGYTGVLLPETLFVTLLVWGVVLAAEGTLRGPARAGPLWFLGAGAVLGLAILTRSVALPVPFLVLLWMRWVPDRVGRRRWAARCSVLLLGVVLVVAPWTVRNVREQHAPVLVDTVGGLNLLIGNNPHSWGLYDERFVDTPGYRRAFAEGRTPAERDAIMRQEALGWVVRHPARFAAVTGARAAMALTIHIDWVGRYTEWERLMGGRLLAPFVRPVVAVYQWALMLLGSAGAVLAVRRRRALILPVVLAGYQFAVMAVFYVQVRYRLPAMPFVILLAASALGILLSAVDPAAVRNAELE